MKLLFTIQMREHSRSEVNDEVWKTFRDAGQRASFVTLEVHHKMSRKTGPVGQGTLKTCKINCEIIWLGSKLRHSLIEGCGTFT